MAPTTKDQAALTKQFHTPPPPGSPYSLPVPGSAIEGRSAIYRNFHFVDRPLLQTLDPEVRTAHDAFERSVRKTPNARCLGSRPYNSVTKQFGKYEWMTYAQTALRRKNFGAGLVELHSKVGVTGTGYGVGLWCQNRPEWQLCDLGSMSQSLFTVSIYDTLGPDATEYIINHATLTCVATSLAHIPTLLKLAPNIPTLKLIVSLDPLDAGEQAGESKQDLLNALAADTGITIYSIKDVEALGAASNRPMVPPRPEDIVTINYTSGTTGNPKGVVLTQANAVAAMSSSTIISDVLPTDIMISYLPLAHIYERAVEHNYLANGAGLGYFHGDTLGLVDDMKALKPTGFVSVPRLYNRFGTAIRAATIEAPGLKGAIGRHVINSKLASMKLPPGKATNKHMIYDSIYTPKVRAAVGLDRVRGMISGSAPLDPSLHQFLRAAFGNDIVQGYGMTETYAISLAQMEGDMSAGNCGAVVPGMELCLQSVPSMDYLVTDSKPRGELLIRGNALFREYYRNPEETAKVILKDGWFRSGDIAEIDSLGRFTIIDRVKNVLKLAQGEYISPERIENIYLANSNLFAQSFVHGDSTQAFLVSVFGVDPVGFAPFASGVLKKTIEPTDIEAVQAAARDDRVRKAVVKHLDHIGKKNKFNSYEKVRAVHLEIEPFTIENELLTPTLKLKRPQTAKKFRDHLDRLYEEALAEERPRAKL